MRYGASVVTIDNQLPKYRGCYLYHASYASLGLSLLFKMIIPYKSIFMIKLITYTIKTFLNQFHQFNYLRTS